MGLPEQRHYTVTCVCGGQVDERDGQCDECGAVWEFGQMTSPPVIPIWRCMDCQNVMLREPASRVVMEPTYMGVGYLEFGCGACSSENIEQVTA